MSLEFEPGVPWHRLHDPPVTPDTPKAPFTVRPTSLEEITRICRHELGNGPFHALGSHWALSEAARSDRVFIETHDPDGQHRVLGRTLYDVVPRAMNERQLAVMARSQQPDFTLVHVEAGKQICQLYAELDQVDPLTNEKTLAGWMAKHHQNRGYAGPWGFPTMGGAGGQTIVGALTTGTHGGDFDRAPLADYVAAIHLVVDGGKHYWIERRADPPLTDDDKLKQLYGTEIYGGSSNFEIRRDNDLFNAVLVSAGRFGVIYSVVLLAVPQYNLYDRRGLKNWDEVKILIGDRTSWLYTSAPTPVDPDFRTSSPVTSQCRFLQVAVCLTSHGNFSRNRVGVTQRWQLVLPTDPAGRAERVGAMTPASEPLVEPPQFANAGHSHSYSPHPGQPATPSFLEIACSNADFVKGLLQATVDELNGVVQSHGAVVAGTVATVAVVGGTGLLILLGAFVGLIELLKVIIDSFDHNAPLGATMQNVKNTLLNPPIGSPNGKSAGLFVWQVIALKIFETLQSERDVEAISYAIMDSHDYLDVGCFVVGDSIEVFFDATDPMLISFIDLLIAFEQRQELAGLAFVGYASLRFTQQTRALIGMQKWPLTCSVEIAGLGGVSGSIELIKYAQRLTLNHNVAAILHWGQHNDQKAEDTERIFGDRAVPTASNLGRWRAALGSVTDNGAHAGFSSLFTQTTGLEVVSAAMREFSTNSRSVHVGDTISVYWDARNNPPGTTVGLNVIRDPGGPRAQRRVVAEPGGLEGSYSFPAEEPGVWAVGLSVRPPGGDPRGVATSSIVIAVESDD